jgi:hypothetical protein
MIPLVTFLASLFSEVSARPLFASLSYGYLFASPHPFILPRWNSWMAVQIQSTFLSSSRKSVHPELDGGDGASDKATKHPHNYGWYVP